MRGRALVAASACLLLIVQADVLAMVADESIDVPAALAEALTGVRRSHIVRDREGNVVAVGFPAPGGRRADKAEEIQILVCGVSESVPEWGQGQGAAFRQDAVLSTSTDSYYYVVYIMPPGKGKMLVQITARADGPSGPREHSWEPRLKRGFYYLSQVQLARLTAAGLHVVTMTVAPSGGDSCETGVFAYFKSAAAARKGRVTDRRQR